MKVHYSTTKQPYPVAYETDEGELTLVFGKYKDRQLIDVPDKYLTWMVTSGPLPAPVIAAVEQHRKQRRHDYPVSYGFGAEMRLPDLRSGEDVVEWAIRAPAGDVAEVAAFLRQLEEKLGLILDHRANLFAQDRGLT